MTPATGRRRRLLVAAVLLVTGCTGGSPAAPCSPDVLAAQELADARRLLVEPGWLPGLSGATEALRGRSWASSPVARR